MVCSNKSETDHLDFNITEVEVINDIEIHDIQLSDCNKVYNFEKVPINCVNIIYIMEQTKGVHIYGGTCFVVLDRNNNN